MRTIIELFLSKLICDLRLLNLLFGDSDLQLFLLLGQLLLGLRLLRRLLLPDRGLSGHGRLEHLGQTLFGLGQLTRRLRKRLKRETKIVNLTNFSKLPLNSIQDFEFKSIFCDYFDDLH